MKRKKQKKTMRPMVLTGEKKENRRRRTNRHLGRKEIKESAGRKEKGERRSSQRLKTVYSKDVGIRRAVHSTSISDGRAQQPQRDEGKKGKDA